MRTGNINEYSIERIGIEDIGSINSLIAANNHVATILSSKVENGNTILTSISDSETKETSKILDKDNNIIGYISYKIKTDLFTTTNRTIFIDETMPYADIDWYLPTRNEQDIFETAIETLYKKTQNIRIQVSESQKNLGESLSKMGFHSCGFLGNGIKQYAFQKINTRLTINRDLKGYIIKEIIPKYDCFDKAHQRHHVLKVIEESLKYTFFYDVDPNMSMCIAAYHDLGLVEGREKHHVFSSQIIKNDTTLGQWFSKEQIDIMADAAEDHRASSNKAPRTIYGKIVAEADRTIDCDDILTRTIQYGLDNYPKLSCSEHIGRAIEHLEEKYSENGYIKLWIPESSNKERLKELHNLIKRKDDLKNALKDIYEKEMGDLKIQ